MGSRVDVGDKTNCALLSPVEVKSSSHSCMVFVSNNDGGKLSIIINGVRFVRKTCFTVIDYCKSNRRNNWFLIERDSLLLAKDITATPLKQ